MKIINYIISFIFLFACSSNTNVKGTSWTVEEKRQSVVISFKDSIIEFVIKDNGKTIGKVSSGYSYVGDTILIGRPNNCDKAVIKGNKLLFIEKRGITEFKRIK